MEHDSNQFPMSDFPAEEYRQRTARLKLIMEARGLDAVLVSEYNNFRYFAGFDPPFSAWSGNIRTRPFICIIPRKADPVLIVHASFSRASRDMSWIGSVVEWVDLPFSAEIVEPVLRDLGLHEQAVVGFELGGEQRFGFPPQTFLDLCKALPRMQAVDADPALTELRLIKSPAEIECIRNACAITADSYDSLFDTLRPGNTEIEIELLMRKLMTSSRGEGPNFVLVSIHPGGVTGRKPSSRALAKGDILWMDSGAISSGYRSDFSRVAVVGDPSAAQKEAYEIVRTVTMYLISQIRPGMTTSELNSLCEEELKKRGIPPKKAGRIGHGIGLDTGEAPSVMASDRTILKPGMVFTVEPGLLADFGYFVLEEICAVTETGCQVLTRNSAPSLPVIC